MPRYDWVGIDRAKREQSVKGDSGVRPAAPKLSTNDVAYEQFRLTSFARDRILGVGDEQYVTPENGQKYQSKPDAELVQDVKEEIADTINYLTFIYVNLAHRLGVTT